MKTIIIAALALASLAVGAHEIQGTLVLKGALKQKIMVNGLKTTCKVKVDDVKNLMEEDSFGNPAYKLKLKVSLDGSDWERNLKVDFDKEYLLTNLFTEGNQSVVKDLEYASADGTTMLINEQGRMKRVQFTFGAQRITCAF